jgi:hypothetical protein
VVTAKQIAISPVEDLLGEGLDGSVLGNAAMNKKDTAQIVRHRLKENLAQAVSKVGPPLQQRPQEPSQVAVICHQGTWV